MEAQMHRPAHGHNQFEEDPHATGLHSGEEHGEKKSVLKKVKDKAKKIKDTIKKHGTGHDDEEDEDDTEMMDDPHAKPDVHGAPVYESTVIRGTDLPMQVPGNLEKPNDPREDRVSHHEGHDYSKTGHYDLVRPPVSQAPHEHEKSNVGESGVQIRPLEGLEEDPHSPTRRGGISPSNYESKVSGPTRTAGKEADVDPLVRQLDNLRVHDESKLKQGSDHSSFTGSHDQFAPQTTPTKNEFSPGSGPVDTSTKPTHEYVDPVDPETIPAQATVTGKISSATLAIADRAISAKNVVASKLGYGGVQQPQQTNPDSASKPVMETAGEYAHMAYEKVASAGSAVISKVPGIGGTGSAGANQAGEQGVTGVADKGVSMKEYLSEKFKPGDEDRELSGVISDALHKKKESGEGHPVMGKVTESEEVKQRLGRGLEGKREGEDAFAAGVESSGPGVVGRVKDAVSSWLGKSTGVETAQHGLEQSYVSGTGTGAGAGQGQEGENIGHPKSHEE